MSTITMANSELPIFIPVKVLEDYFQCSICLSSMQSPMTTSCGHRFCNKCISEWVDRQHNCPCCNTVLDKAHLFKDHQFNGLIEACKKEKDKAESLYFENLINAAVDEKTTGQYLHIGTPVEEVLKKHLKSSLAAHELYFQDLRRQYERQQQQLEIDLRKEIEHLQLDGLAPAVFKMKIEEVEKSIQEKKDTLAVDLQQCQELVADAFDRYLSAHISNLDILPVNITVVLADKNIRIPDVTINPSDDLTVVQMAVEENLKRQGDQVIRWHPDGGKLILVSPLNKQALYNVNQILEDIINGGDNYPGIQPVSWLTKPVLQLQMKPGSELVLSGCVLCESDLPKVCYMQIYKEKGPQKVDYFSCKNCGFSWICRNCSQSCHKGHDVSVYVLNHQPTWACCYCPKKKSCSLQSASSVVTTK